jgi:simple sugar transport system permease protein/ribose transport system permease protein
MTGNNINSLLRRNSMLIILLALYVIVATTAQGFFTVNNQLNILRNIAVPGMIAFGMALVIIVGEIDLSVGSMVAVSACLTAWIVEKLAGNAIEPAAWTVIVAFAGTFLFAASVGFMSGKLRQLVNVPTFITSLAMMATLAGLANLITNGVPISSFPSW